jgi:hypothetical protein
VKTAETLAENAAAFVADFLALVAERDEALSILRSFVAAEETAKTSTTTSFFEYSDAMDRARELLGQP